MDNSLHTISLHRFKYVGSSYPIPLHRFYYIFKAYIGIYKTEVGLKKVNNIHFINKISINSMLDKITFTEMNILNNTKLAFEYHVNYLNKIKQPNILHKVTYLNQINKYENKTVFYMKLINEMNKLTNDILLENKHNEYMYIAKNKIKNNKQLLHQERNVIFINKMPIPKLIQYINLDVMNKITFNPKLFIKYSQKIITKQEYNNFLLDLMINNIISKIKVNRDLNKQIIPKDIEINKNNNIGLDKIVTKQIDKTELNKFVSKFIQTNINLIDTMSNVDKIQYYEILKNQQLKYIDATSKNIQRNNIENKFIDIMPVHIYKDNSIMKFITKGYKDMNSISYVTTNLNKVFKDMNINNNNIKFIEKTFKNLNINTTKEHWLKKTYLDIDKTTDVKWVKDTYKELDKTNLINFIDKTYLDTNIIDITRLMKKKLKSKINKVDSKILMNKKCKDKIIKHSPIFVKQTYKNISIQDINLYDKIAIHNINKTFVRCSLDKVFNNISIIDINKPIKKIYKDIDKVKNPKEISIAPKKINKYKNIQSLNRENIKSISKVKIGKMLERNNIQSIDVVKDILKYFEVKRDWWVIEHDIVTDKLIIPNIDYPYENEPVMGIDKHPISSIEQINYQDTKHGIKEIEVSIRIMQQMLNIIFMMWHIVNDYYKTLTPVEAIEKTMYVFYYWLNIDKIKEEMINKNSREDYLRVYRWFRWEAEKVWIKEKDDVLNTGVKSIGMLLAELIEYMKNHHYNIVPLTNKDNLIIVDNMLEVFKLKINDYYYIPSDKKKGKRKYMITSKNNHNKQNFITNK